MIVPDSIEPVIGWRAWDLSSGQLGSLNQTGHIWPFGEPCIAKCLDTTVRVKTEWHLKHGGGVGANEVLGYFPQYGVANFFTRNTSPIELRSPKVIPPSGYGWEYVTVPIEHGSIPAEECSCGIYALKTAAEAIDYLRSYTTRVLGMVSLWGKVIPGGNGWRAERAYPKKLWLLSDKQSSGFFRKRVIDRALDTAAVISEKYGVPCDIVGDVRELVGVV